MQACRHEALDLIAIFDGLFAEREGTRLIRGDDEPVYLPRDAEHPHHRIVFAHGFFASALHEIAHWCIAGRERRQIVDYGYWYQPDGRSAELQRSFESVEVRPQALEWIFSTAAGSAFHFSADNLAAGGAVVSDAWHAFQKAVLAQVHTYLVNGLPCRARRFAASLAAHYGTGELWCDAASYRLMSV